MTEKEFILAFFEWVEATQSELNDLFDVEECIAKFLPYFHETYYEVEFVKKQETFYGIPYFLDNDCIDKDKAYLVRDGKILGHIVEFDLKPEEPTKHTLQEETKDTLYVKRVSPIVLTAEEAETMLKVQKEQMEKFTKNIK